MPSRKNTLYKVRRYGGQVPLFHKTYEVEHTKHTTVEHTKHTTVEHTKHTTVEHTKHTTVEHTKLSHFKLL